MKRAKTKTRTKVKTKKKTANKRPVKKRFAKKMPAKATMPKPKKTRPKAGIKPAKLALKKVVRPKVNKADKAAIIKKQKQADKLLLEPVKARCILCGGDGKFRCQSCNKEFCLDHFDVCMNVCYECKQDVTDLKLEL